MLKKTVVLSLAVLAYAAAARAADPKPEEASPRAAAPFAVRKGFRGVALLVPLDQIAFLKKGDRADVLVTFDAVMDSGSKEKVTATIMQNVGVLDVAKVEGKGVVELLLNPNEAQYGILGIYQGQLSVTRRSADDTELKPMEMASFRKLFK